MIKISTVNPGSKVYIDNTIGGASALFDKLNSINIHVTHDKTKVVNLKIDSHDILEHLLLQLKMTPFKVSENYCICNMPTMFDVDPRKWENHEMGKCGFPFEACSDVEHRKMYCLNCGDIIKVAFCAHNTSSFSLDNETELWVDSYCGLPKRAYYESLDSNKKEKVSGKRAFLYREYEQAGADTRGKLSKELNEKEKVFSSTIKVVKS